MPAVLGAYCGACLLSTAIASERDRVGEYQIFELLGEGAMGMVYLAQDPASGEFVAVKLAKPALIDSPDGVELFRQQARIENALEHPNIVHVRSAGTHGGTPFSVMPLMEGGSLAEEQNAARYRDPRARLGLMIKIARALHFAHGRGVMHCDIKHENVLFDAAGEPHLSDFGLARNSGAAGALVSGEVRGGTSGWMSPEQVRDWISLHQSDSERTPPSSAQINSKKALNLSIESDVFTLGALLYWLTHREFPFGVGVEFEHRVLHDPPPPLPKWSPDLEWGLSAVAHKAMQKEPGDRYASAAAFADDLERLRSHRPPLGSRVPPWARVWYWSERHPGAGFALVVMLACFAAVAAGLCHMQRLALREAVLDMNAYAASGQAAAVLYQLRDYADTVERAAEDPAIRALTRGPRRTAPPLGREPLENPCSGQAALEDSSPLEPYRLSFSTMMVLDAEGCSRARVSEEPAPLDFIQRRLDYRDYFTGARADGIKFQRTTAVRKAYRSSVSNLIKFAVSTSLFEGDQWIGVVTGSLTARSTLELPRMKRRDTADRMTVLLGPFEGERPSPVSDPVPSSDVPEFTFLVHPKLGNGEKLMLPAEWAKPLDVELRRELGSRPEPPSQFELGTSPPLQRSDYVDPKFGDRWLAAFAPVGGTGYVVLVQTRDGSATRPSDGLKHLAIALGLLSAGLGLSWGGFSVWRWRRERAVC